MKLTVSLDHDHASAMVAHLIEGQIHKKPDSWIALPSNIVNQNLYDYLKEAHGNHEVDFSHAHFILVSEYHGLGPDHPASVYHTIHEAFFEPCSIPEDHIHRFDGLAESKSECNAWNQFLDMVGPLDLIIAGIGYHGHIAHNRPSEALYPRVHEEFLDEGSRQRLAKHFDDLTEVPNRIITLGIQDLLNAKKLVLYATGSVISSVISQLVETKVISTQFPASFVLLHSNALLVIDQDAASQTGIKIPVQ